MRCLTLANALQKSNIDSIFICRPEAGSLEDFIRSLGFKVETLDRNGDFVPSRVTLGTRTLMHGEFLWSTQELDALESERILSPYNAVDNIIVDHYGIHSHWDDYLKNKYKIFKIDDLADRLHNCTGLVDQNFFCNFRDRYNGLVPNHAKTLLGPDYAMLRPQFKNINTDFRRKRVKPNRVLISFGGSDPNDYSLSVAKALLGAMDVEITILGRSSPESTKSWAKLVSDFPTKVRGPQFLTDPKPELLWADLYIGAGGSITWERFACGLGGIVYSIAENQVQMAQDLEMAGIQYYAGSIANFDPEQLITLVSKYFSDPGLIDQSYALRRIVDGHGVDRIIDKWGLK
jgi:UDP-2,4-diacetamido-2,4,6-trideoxy-beta-L-altropyranose hydrolase